MDVKNLRNEHLETIALNQLLINEFNDQEVVGMLSALLRVNFNEDKEEITKFLDKVKNRNN